MSASHHDAQQAARLTLDPRAQDGFVKFHCA